jgi:predicted RNase H-like HicB family nuclease
MRRCRKLTANDASVNNAGIRQRIASYKTGARGSGVSSRFTPLGRKLLWQEIRLRSAWQVRTNHASVLRMDGQPIPSPKRVTIDGIELTIEFDREEDGRIIAEVLELPGVMVYGLTFAEALAHVLSVAAAVLDERKQQGEQPLQQPITKE